MIKILIVTIIPMVGFFFVARQEQRVEHFFFFLNALSYCQADPHDVHHEALLQICDHFTIRQIHQEDNQGNFCAVGKKKFQKKKSRAKKNGQKFMFFALHSFHQVASYSALTLWSEFSHCIKSPGFICVLFCPPPTPTSSSSSPLLSSQPPPFIPF